MTKSRPLMLYFSGGPQINFRAGRIDAQQAGPPGVPQPQESLQSHTTAFARMGFTPTEMIQLVACGHTIGGVQKVAFPDIVPATAATSANPDGNMAFDQTPTSFDNHM
jgi:catalase (peroxidase I)